MNYELVSGFETHVELSTKTKIFCSCEASFSSSPNIHCCPVCIGLPGTLPKLNREVVRFAIMAGLATNCTISNVSKMDRKNYAYPDLPKAYQISQYDMPLCKNGYIKLSSGRKIRILRIHIEEDAGKLIHDNGDIYIDYNRGGVPLIEIVSEPDIRSIDEAREYVEKLRLIMKYIGVSDCKMQEGSMRCDVNISVRPMGSDIFGTRTEIKNMNSINNIAKAMEYEFDRQIDLIESGESVIQETLRYDDTSGVTSSMRSKEDAHDYRYFREPDLVSINISDDEIEQIRKALPMLPDERLDRYISLGIPEKDAYLIVKYKKAADFFDEVILTLDNPRIACNYILGQIFRRLENEEAKEAFDIKITPKQLNQMLKLIEQGKLSNNLAKSALEKMLDSGRHITEFVSESDMRSLDEDALKQLCRKAIDANLSAVADYKNGKLNAMKALIGFVMKESRGKADAIKAEEIIKNIIL